MLYETVCNWYIRDEKTVMDRQKKIGLRVVKRYHTFKVGPKSVQAHDINNKTILRKKDANK